METQTTNFNSFLANPSKNLQFPRDKSQCCPHSFFGSTKKLLLRTQLIWLFQLLICTAQWDGVMVTQSDYQSLQAFKRELIDTEGFLKSWNDSGEGACSGGWIGVKCAQGQVIVIQLPWKGLGGKISESIGQFQALRKLSLHDNLLQGPIPLSLGFLRNLRGIQLFNNKLSGSIPHSLGSCPLLQTLDFSNNSLTGEIPGGIFGSANLSGLNLSFNSLFGSIPSEIGRLYKLTTLDLSNAGINGSLPVSLSNLSSLSVLNLQGNRLSGQIPATFGRISSLTELDLAYNNLSGEIPSSLGDLPKLAYFNASYNNFSGSVPTHLYQKFNSSSFVGNLHLCGYTASTPCPPPASPAHIPGRSAETNRTHHRRHDSRNIIFIGFGIFIVVVLCFLVLCYLTRKTAVSKVKDSQPGGKAGRARPEKGGEGGGETGGKLVRFEGPVALTEEGLFSAMAEALGKSTYGTAYKATMEDGKQLAVKRLRAKLTKSRKELEAEVKLLGKIRHPNLLALRAYYFGPRGDKLLVFDFMPRGSLARLLHAQRPGMPLDWPTRVKIVRGTAQGLLYLHAHVKIVHGNLTSSNVLLDEQMNPKVSDYALSRLMVGEANANAILAAEALGYWAPELSRLENANMKTDVYSLGVIVLELVTGKSPTEARNNGMDLPRWVASAMEERKVNEVFDPKLRKHTSVVQNELIETLKLALHCVNLLPSARPEVEQVLQRVEEIRPENGATKVWQ